MPFYEILAGGMLGCLAGVYNDKKVKKLCDVMSLKCGAKYKGLLAGHIQGKGSIEVLVKCAKNLKNMDSGIMGDLSDPFVVVKCGTQQFKTRVIDDDLNPVWNEKFTFDVDFTNPETPEEDKFIYVSAFDKNTFTADDPLGSAEVFIPYLSFSPGDESPYVIDLQDGDGATLEFGVRFFPK